MLVKFYGLFKYMFITFVQTQAEIIDEDIKYADKLLVETKLAQVPITNQHDDQHFTY